LVPKPLLVTDCALLLTRFKNAMGQN